MASISERGRRERGLSVPFVCLAILVSLLAGCATISDGAYEQVEGRHIDRTVYATLTEGKTTTDEALALFGPADSREALAQGFEQFSWHSVRVRQSITSVAGKVTNQHAARSGETLLLQFFEGRLVHKSLTDDSASAAPGDCKAPRRCR